jgi:hypothetical protein
MLGGATAIMIARMRVIEEITLFVKQPHYADDAGIRKGSGVRISRLDGEALHL